ncbi:DUF4139 domain-containing protein [Treponema medium]|uniref:DUF4139 domain-containing protein n=2 Tax=Treponema medium TaxID=58231 RepID=A0AA87TFT8_TREMD|nr:DUF4139 domain-containing protein [Treponema medium]EPF29915.1 hypothetical protein HMPREF9195_00629 [Treponema medium ATCC 700293]QSH96778.1 DUF4139 domain-containing protein [Treponema medium]
MKNMIFTILSAACIVGAAADPAKNFSADDIPLKKVTLYSSGVAHYVHEGTVAGSGNIALLFSPAQINDVLKSLVVMDPGAKSLAVNYQSEDTLRKTLESLKIDLSAATTLYDILKAQKGAEVELFTPHQIIGKILSVDKNSSKETDTFFISLAAKDGIHIIAFSDIQSFKFTDKKRNEDLNTALALILDASAKNRKKLDIKIDAQGERKIGLSYVMEAPVWKASYRLDMGTDKAAFQAWAIIDNSTDLDWKNITLTLTTGRPVGFTQNLYAPYYTYRPEVPLAIAQAAEAETFDSADRAVEYAAAMPLAEKRSAMMKKEAYGYTVAGYDEAEYDDLQEKNDSAYFENQAEAGNAGEMFAFTPSKPVTLERQQSTMIPLTLASLPAEKYSVFSSIPYNERVNPKFCISIENTSGLKLPAGPITVLDGGEYAGDALLEFLPEAEKRLIAYGDDIEVTGSKRADSTRTIETIKMTDGVMTTSYRQVQSTTYLIRNANKKERTVIVEHAKNAGFELTTKQALAETTANKYRFKFKAAGNTGTELKVEETRTYRSSQKIFDMNSNTFISYTTNSEIPDKVRKAFTSIITEKEKVTAAEKALKTLQDRQTEIGKEQDRVRRNLEAVGSESQQGRAFLTKLLKLETELDNLKTDIADATEQLTKAQQNFTAFVKSIKVD